MIQKSTTRYGAAWVRPGQPACPVDDRPPAQRQQSAMHATGIATELHTAVIQQLFAIGLSLHWRGRECGIRPGDGTYPGTNRAARRHDPQDPHHGLGLHDPLRQARPACGTSCSTSSQRWYRNSGSRSPSACSDHRGSLDSEVADDRLADLREALSNVVRHARARSVDVEVAAQTDRLDLLVEDDAVRIAPAPQLPRATTPAGADYPRPHPDGSRVPADGS